MRRLLIPAGVLVLLLFAAFLVQVNRYQYLGDVGQVRIDRITGKREVLRQGRGWSEYRPDAGPGGLSEETLSLLSPEAQRVLRSAPQSPSPSAAR